MNARRFLVRFVSVVCAVALLLFISVAAVPLLRAQDSEQGKPAPAPKPDSTEGFKAGIYEGHANFETGYRWVSDTAGSKDMYRSMINLGEGFKLFRSDISLRSKLGAGLFDRLDLSMNSWGGEPYNTMNLSIGRSDVYEFRANYRNLKYYNFIPTFANPLLSSGSLLDQHGLDVSYRTTDLELKLFPNSKVRPYFAYARTSGFGPGYTTNHETGNEFLLNTRWQYASDEYRGGLELSLSSLVLTLEQGYQSLRNDSAVVSGTDTTGNHPAPFLGQSITLSSLNRSYHDRTSLPVSKVIAKFVPFDQLKITGKYIYSMADLDSSMSEAVRGNFISIENRLIYRSALDSFSGNTKRPSHNASFLVELSPISRVTITHAFETRNFHVSGAALLASLFSNALPLTGVLNSSSVATSDLLNSSLAYDRTRIQTDVEGELGRGFFLHAGHRYTAIDTSLEDAQGLDINSRAVSLAQQSGLAGIVFRHGRSIHLALDYEKNSSDHALTRTDLLSYDQLKFDARFNLSQKLSATAHIAFLRNANSQSDIDLKAHNRNYSVALNYDPCDRFSLSLDYSRSNIYSDMAIILPQSLALDRSLFDERGHAIGGSMGFGIYRGVRFDLGYHGILNVGSFPLNYHQPFAALSIPLHKHLAFRSNWQYFGYNEKGSSLQDHRTHLMTYSLAYSY